MWKIQAQLKEMVSREVQEKGHVKRVFCFFFRKFSAWFYSQVRDVEDNGSQKKNKERERESERALRSVGQTVQKGLIRVQRERRK